MGAKPCIPTVLVMMTIMSIGSWAEAQTASSGGPLSKDGCPDRCGDVIVPYPFGVGSDCALSDDFVMECEAQSPRLSGTDMDVLNITLESGKARLRWGYISYICDGQSVVAYPGINLKQTRYKLSYTDNTFFASGCNNTARVDNTKGRFFGCATSCRDPAAAADTCSGYNGCCQISIPTWLNVFEVEDVKDDDDYDGSQCSSIVLAENGNFGPNEANRSLAGASTAEQKSFPIVWDWVVEKITCDEAVGSPSYACVDANSECANSTYGEGYLCMCSDGFQGNPYLSGGCVDIDECLQIDLCPQGQTCRNTEGSYACTTSDGFPLYGMILIGIGVGLVVLGLLITWMYCFLQRRRYMKLRENFFQQNGGLLLQQHISGSGQDKSFKIFKAAELEKATDGYDKDRVLGRGGFGTVYKGVFPDGRVVAIKRSMMVDEGKSREFAKEMLILSQINHVNVVKLLGCCLEVEVPMLVYEFVPCGTLFQHIHHSRSFPWEVRLKIAAESAKALGYLHADASPSILHGDVKSANVLLDDGCTAKVSDFGTSTLAPKDRTRFMTVVQGTWGYLDPEYLQTCQLTDKSDVYSFGVVMAELLSGRKALYKGDDGEEKSLAFEFSRFAKEGRLVEILDDQIAGNKASRGQIEAVAEITVRCLNMIADERPTMTQISMELEMLKASAVAVDSHQHHAGSGADPDEKAMANYHPNPISVTVEYTDSTRPLIPDLGGGGR